MPSDKQA